MMKKRNKILQWALGSLFLLTFFTSLKIIANYYYVMKTTKGHQTLAMILMDKLHPINFTSLFFGIQIGAIITILIVIVLGE